MLTVKVTVFYVYLLFLIPVLSFEGHKQEQQSKNVDEELYIKLFKSRRVEQLDAVKSLQRLSSYEQKYNMVIAMAEKVFTVMQSSRALIEASGFIPGVSEFPADEISKDALSNILENTALFAEVVLRLPDISQSVLKINNNWDILLQWSIAFTNQVRYLLDKSTIKLLQLVSQELNHVEQQPGYVNPYRQSESEEKERQVLSKAEEKKRNKKKIKKGPRIYNEL